MIGKGLGFVVLIQNEIPITVDHDIEITDATKGVILKAADGGRWRLTVENDGSISTTKL